MGGERVGGDAAHAAAAAVQQQTAILCILQAGEVLIDPIVGNVQVGTVDLAS
jgi:hypothetical protein